MIRSLFTVRQSPIQRILTNTNVYNKSVSNSIFQISLVSQTRHLATNKKKITAEKLEKLEKNLEEQEYAENPEEIARPTKLLAKITAIHREKWHLKQKPKDLISKLSLNNQGSGSRDPNPDPEAKLSANKIFKMTPIDPKLLNFIQTEKLAMQRFQKGQKKQNSLRNVEDSEVSAADKFFQKKLRLVYSASTKGELPPKFIPEVAFVGRSNVGKSSLINAIANSKIVKTSPKPGETRAANFYSVGDRLLLVDLPGYGFAYAGEETKSNWQQMIFHYLTERSSLKKTLLLIDSRVPIKKADREMFAYFDQTKSKFQVVMTKTDLVKADDLARRHHLLTQELKKYKCALPEIFLLSSYTGAGISRLRGHLGGLAMTDLQIKQMIKNKQEKEAKQEAMGQQQQPIVPEEKTEVQQPVPEKKERQERPKKSAKPKKEKKSQYHEI